MAAEFTLINNLQNSAADTVEILFSAAADTRILNFTVTNNTGVNRSYRAYIYDAGGSSTGATVPLKFVTSNRGYDLAPAIIGHVVPAGGSIRTESSAANSLIFRATGRLV
jgi:hypothetical protein